MNILVVCSVINFRDFTRRATIEAIKKEVDNLDVLFYTGIKNFLKKKITVDGIRFLTYHFWVPDKFKRIKFFGFIEHKIRGLYWSKKILKYDIVFITDPNQAWLLSYIKQSKIVYLLRDPNILQNKNNSSTEKILLLKSNTVLATSKNLANNYVPRFYGIECKYIYYWPNCVDINIWDNTKYLRNRFNATKIIGVAGNFDKIRTDYLLLDYITSQRTDLIFEIAGTIDYNQSKTFWDNLLSKKNVKYLGFVPFDLLPKVVAKWNVGLITDKIDIYSSYMHHNKVYQYLSLGIPVVSLRIHHDYDDFYPCVQLVPDKEQYLIAIRFAIDELQNHSIEDTCITYAKLNSSEERAKTFLNIVNKS